MIDFIEYIVAELKSKRLTKANALALIRQFSQRSDTTADPKILHPMLHKNDSDFEEQRYVSTFTGREFFLEDHKVSGKKTLPGVAYLEMARAAIKHALPRVSSSEKLELFDITWLNLLFVEKVRDVYISVFTDDQDTLCFDIYSRTQSEELVHCRGKARFPTSEKLTTIDLEQLKNQTQQHSLSGSDAYAIFQKMGLEYGPAHQGLKTIFTGENSVLAVLSLPENVSAGFDQYVIHPGLLDAALQASLGFSDNFQNIPSAPSIPFALERIRVYETCQQQMYALLKYTEGSKSSKAVKKLDIQVFDHSGKICLDLEGFSYREFTAPEDAKISELPLTQTLVATPNWQSSEIDISSTSTIIGSEQQTIVICDLPNIDITELTTTGNDWHCVYLDSNEASVAQRYEKYALACLQTVKEILRNKPQKKVLIQLAMANSVDCQLFSGLLALLQTASQENPHIMGQVIMVDHTSTTSELVKILQENQLVLQHTLVRYQAGKRYIFNWEETHIESSTIAQPYKENGVYLITGGTGGLGAIVARNILSQFKSTTVLLTGRAELSVSEWNMKREAVLNGLRINNSRIHYQALDLSDQDKTVACVSNIQKSFTHLNGIIHCAGMIDDDFILKKQDDAFKRVLEPKVLGTVNLDTATKSIPLDFFALFSSVSGAVGNPGQVDYACANAFMDRFAHYRQTLVEKKQRFGQSCAINWPLWENGGLKTTAQTQEAMHKRTGMVPLPSSEGIEIMGQCLGSGYQQVLVMRGAAETLRKTVFKKDSGLQEESKFEPELTVNKNTPLEDIHELTEEYLRKQFASHLKVSPQKVDIRAPLENYGMNSILAMDLTTNLESNFGTLPKTLFFEYQTIAELSEYFLISHRDKLESFLQNQSSGDSAKNLNQPRRDEIKKATQVSDQKNEGLKPVEHKIRPRFSTDRLPSAKNSYSSNEPIAIVGLSGRYPQSENIEEYWKNLSQGIDCITEVPDSRWNWRDYYSEDRKKAGAHYSKWGGFIAGFDEFDPLFFNISPLEAELTDPQERLFLQHAWMAVEDAGYTRASLQIPQKGDLAAQVGVYVGVMYSEYPLLAAELSQQGKPTGIGGSIASIANRVSYVLNLHGPCMTLDSMCSSSLTAIHLACQDLKLGRTQLAIAGGVNLSIHPNKYLVLSGGQFISSDGHCQSFGEGGDGYIPGEGVGAVILKRLSEAEADGNHIYGVIRGSALNHGGKTNGYSVPNPQAQTSVINLALEEAQIDPRHISYIEAHGTGTRLGDPIEIAALSKSFFRGTTAKPGNDYQYCLIGSAKSNIGHCESAAGIAGLTKVLLQMKHGYIAPSLHSKILNPNIDFDTSPFIVNQHLSEWVRPVIEGREVPRISGISSFGAGGSNAHILIEEYREKRAINSNNNDVVIVLSARTLVQLQQKAKDLLHFVADNGNEIDLASLAYTLQVGREPMAERLGFTVNNISELDKKLRSFLTDTESDLEFFQGRTSDISDGVDLLGRDEDMMDTIEKWIARKKFSRLLELWVRGLDLDWTKLYGDDIPRLMSLPVYPFDKKRYWVEVFNSSQSTTSLPYLHPLLHRNTSDLNQQKYVSVFNGSEFFLTDHQVETQKNAPVKVLPAVAYIEMVHAAIEHALAIDKRDEAIVLHNLAWSQPVICNDNITLTTRVSTCETGRIQFSITSDESTVHSEGEAVLIQKDSCKVDMDRFLKLLEASSIQPVNVYDAFEKMGMHYGSSFRGISRIGRTEGDNREVVAKLSLPEAVVEEGFSIHPTVLDSALQASLCMLDDYLEADVSPSIPFAVDQVRFYRSSASEMYAWVRKARDSAVDNAIDKLDIDLLCENGEVCVQLEGLSVRRIQENSTRKTESSPIELLFASPQWTLNDLPSNIPGGNNTESEQHIVICDLDNVNEDELDNKRLYTKVNFSIAETQFNDSYKSIALNCFNLISDHLKKKPQSKLVFKLVIANTSASAMVSGLSGLLKTASLENPNVTTQILLVDQHISSAGLEAILAEENGNNGAVVKRENGRHQIEWCETNLPESRSAPGIFKDNAVYIITGGLGGLGRIFITEILQNTKDAIVIVTGRQARENSDWKKQWVTDNPSVEERLWYQSVDINHAKAVNMFIKDVLNRHGKLTGIVHSAGIIEDNFILNKSATQFEQVLSPKVDGVIHIDQATKDIPIEFLVLFSSLASVFGNPGQADYASANGFMDNFSNYRNQLVEKGERYGKCVSINWPLWQHGGMAVDQENEQLLEQLTGMRALPDELGLKAFYHCMESGDSQTVVMAGDRKKIQHTLQNHTGSAETKPSASAENLHSQDLIPNGIDFGKTQEFIRGIFANTLKIPAHEIKPGVSLDNYGIDSILAMKLTNALEDIFGSLSKTLFFEYQTLSELSGYFVKFHGSTLLEHMNGGLSLLPRPERSSPAGTTTSQTTSVLLSDRVAEFSRKGKQTQLTENTLSGDIAIVGLNGRFPQADDLSTFWNNLANGQDCITEIPEERWNQEAFYHPDRYQVGKSYCRWGGFLSEVDKFDPMFFNISPREAELLDPQERLFLETVWNTIEDAGYSKESISEKSVGVFVGVMWGQYELYGTNDVSHTGVPSSSFASIANRISYFFNFDGPSIALDTMCSSSLTAVHLACNAIRAGDIEAAIAGGVNISVHPHKYVNLSQGNFASTDGKCRSFGEGGDGYVPGEGVGAVLLKPLVAAIADNDHIYALIKSSAVNHGGKTNGYTVPNPNAQAGVIAKALEQGNVLPESIDYIETHGTGTSLGDPIEITGLINAFDSLGDTGKGSDIKRCPIGSVKSNIGHLESAAGMAALTKVILQLQHNKLVPSLHAEVLNPNINFEETPFYVNTELVDWHRENNRARRVGISSFGAGGSNAHLVVEEHVSNLGQYDANQIADFAEVFVLSAQDKDGLVRYAKKMLDHLESHSNLAIADVAYTSQVGRTPMAIRLAVIASSIEELKSKLENWLAQAGDANWVSKSPKPLNSLVDIFFADTKTSTDNELLVEGDAGVAYLNIILEQADLPKISKLWVSGVDINWALIHRNRARLPKRISLPTYPFNKERYWIDVRTTPVNSTDGGESQVIPVSEFAQMSSYSPEWQQSMLDSKADPSINEEKLLIFTGNEDAIVSTFIADRKNSILVRLNGENFSEVEAKAFVINRNEEGHYHQVLNTLKERNQLPDKILFIANDETSSTGKLDSNLETLLYISQALIKRRQKDLRKLLVLFRNDLEHEPPAITALSGFLKTLTMENPKHQTKLVTLPCLVEIDTCVEILVNEFSDTHWNSDVIRYRAKAGNNTQPVIERYKRVFKDVSNDTNLTTVPIKQSGVYVISGGLGGLGYIFSEHLAKNYHANLILLGRSKRDEKLDKLIQGLSTYAKSVEYHSVDITDYEKLANIIEVTKHAHGKINGIIHCAGTNKDAFILNKKREQMTAVVQPKVSGALNLHKAMKQESLDIFVLFSSMAGATGNIGQCDYAYANAYLDAFAQYRQHEVEHFQCSGNTISINWPYWEKGGMRLSPENISESQQKTGLIPLPTELGIQHFEKLLVEGLTQVLALYGDASKIHTYLTHVPKERVQSDSNSRAVIDYLSLQTRTESYLKELLHKETKIPIDRLDPNERFESFGIDSVMINRFNVTLEQDLGELPKTLIYEYETISELAEYLSRNETASLNSLFDVDGTQNDTGADLNSATSRESITQNALEKLNTELPKISEDIALDDQALDNKSLDEIAIVGLHGLFPGASDLAEYWQNLSEGRDSIGLVPESRWDYAAFYDPEPENAAAGKIYCKWGGFLDEYDHFDRGFFNLSEEEAMIIDPQERLFLQSVWATLEDAGYTAGALKKQYPKGNSSDIGVFAGVTTNSHQILAPEEWRKGNSLTPGAMPWSIANRVSYYFDFQGPSMPIDTACSSSLVAIHMACESIRRRECRAAIAGGVNLYLHPAKYHSFCSKRMVALHGKNRSFGSGDDGFVPGEGVGTLFLKPLSEARMHGDHIYGVVKGSAFEHCGRSNGYSAPNPKSQAVVIQKAMDRARVNPETITYIEGHGTGTQLGDSLEVVSLTSAFQKATVKTHYCALGSVKANIGHSESAAGISGIAKILLQFRHKQIAPSIHIDEVNPDINFDKSPFYLQTGLTDWQHSVTAPRRALINSFGAGGVNACMILEEYRNDTDIVDESGGKPFLIIVSAKTPSQLTNQAEQIRNYLENNTSVSLKNVCYTLQVGREAMSERLAVIGSDLSELIQNINAWLSNDENINVFSDTSVANIRNTRKIDSEGSKGESIGESQNDITLLAQRWVRGEVIDWVSVLYKGEFIKRVPLPTYPFAKEGYWIASQNRRAENVTSGDALETATQLHPLISYNSSTLDETRFTSRLSEKAYYSQDHVVNNQKILPGSAFLEIACIAGNLAAERRALSLRDVVWNSPLNFGAGPQVVTTALKKIGALTEYEITSIDDANNTLVHSEGRLCYDKSTTKQNDIKPIDIEGIRNKATETKTESEIYSTFRTLGFKYAESFTTIKKIYICDGGALARLELPPSLRKSFGKYILHPSLIDGALQAVIGILNNDNNSNAYLPFAIDEIIFNRPLSTTCYAYVEAARSDKAHSMNIMKFNITVVSERGVVLVKLKNFYVRAIDVVDTLQEESMPG